MVVVQGPSGGQLLECATALWLASNSQMVGVQGRSGGQLLERATALWLASSRCLILAALLRSSCERSWLCRS